MNKINCLECVHKDVCMYRPHSTNQQIERYENCEVKYPFILTLECELFRPEITVPRPDIGQLEWVPSKTNDPMPYSPVFTCENGADK